jgi:hypothetical protein
MSRYVPHAELDPPLRVFVRQPQHVFCADEPHAELFGELAAQGLKLALAAIDLSAGEFPAPCHMGARRALRDQYAPGRIEESSGNDSDGTQGNN